MVNPLHVNEVIMTAVSRQPAQVDTETPLPELYGKMPWSDCPEAELGEVITYLKKSQFIRIPPEWWPYIE